MSSDHGHDCWDWADAILDDLAERHMRRIIETLRPIPGTASIEDSAGRLLINFASNDYLGLAHHPSVIAAAQEACSRYGAGSGSSRLIAGSFAVHDELERALAEFKGAEAALVFSSGYLASIGLLQALRNRADGSAIPVFMDRFAHACIVDGAIMGRGPWRRFAHNDPDALERLLSKAPSVPPSERQGPSAIVVTEGVFSMDGDTAPIPELLRLCEQYHAMLVVDDAHGTGTVGPGGHGIAAHFGVTDHPRLIQLGTLSKALGAQGGFVAGPRSLIDLMRNRARTMIFDTALAPPTVAAASAALSVIAAEPERVETLKSRAVALREQLQSAETLPDCGPAGIRLPHSPVIPLVIGEAESTLRVASALRSEGFLAGAVRPPTVPEGTSRLRFAASALHTEAQIRSLAESIRDVRAK